MKLTVNSKRFILALMGMLAIAYTATGLFLYFQQRYLIFRPHPNLSTFSSHSDFQLPYQDVWIPISNSQEWIHSWWFPAPALQEKLKTLPGEPVKILKTPKTILYLCGVGRNMGDYNYLARVAGLRQLGFSILAFDYRGYGRSQGQFPSESQVYTDSQAAWNYLIQQRRIPPKQIVLYGESLGGAIAIDLALKHLEVGGLIVQSSFTSMAEKIERTSLFWLFPIEIMLNQKFDSVTKVRSLQTPVLFIHGTADSIVPFDMNQKLYEAAPEPKQLFLIPGAEHIRIYRLRNNSYLRALQNFVNKY